MEFSEQCKPFYIYMNEVNDYKLTKKRIAAARDFHGKTKIYNRLRTTRPANANCQPRPQGAFPWLHLLSQGKAPWGGG